MIPAVFCVPKVKTLLLAQIVGYFLDMASGSDSITETVAPLNSQRRRARKEPVNMDEVVEVPLEMTRSVPIKAGELVTSRQR